MATQVPKRKTPFYAKNYLLIFLGILVWKRVRKEMLKKWNKGMKIGIQIKYLRLVGL